MIRLFYKAEQKLFIAFIMLIVTHGSIKAQEPAIKGPACIIPGLTYQYNINNKWTDSTIVQVCVTGGHLVSGEMCTGRSPRLVSVFVVWDSSGQRKLHLYSSSGSVELPVQATTRLSGGKIADSNKVQLYDSTKAVYTFHCELATGGSCTPAYVYQWQQSVAGGKWTDIEGAAGKDLQYTASIQTTVRMRRVTTDTASNTVAYSDIAILAIRHQPKQ